MLIEKVNCPYGCKNSVMVESFKRVPISGSNLLLDNSNSPSSAVEIIKSYCCSSCNRSFETHNPGISNGRIVL